MPASDDTSISRKAVYDAMRAVLGEGSGMAVVHSSLAALGPPGRLKPWDLLFAFERLMREGWTFVFPAFTFSFCGGKRFDLRESLSETGILSDWVLKYCAGAVRTAHPIYSFVVLGPETQAILDCATTTTFGDDSPFGLFERKDARLVLLGCGFPYATQFHRYEEEAAVPYRYFKIFEGEADFRDGKGGHPVRAAMYVRELTVDPVNDFLPAVKALDQSGAIVRAPLWRGMVEGVSVKNMADTCRAMLKENPLVFLSNAEAVSFGLAGMREAAKLPPLRLAVLGSANVHLLRDTLHDELAQLLPYRKTEIFEVPFGQLSQSLLDPASELRRLKPEIAIFCDRLEDLAGKSVLDAGDVAQLDARVASHAAEIAAFHDASGGWIVVQRFAALARPTGIDADRVIASLVDRANAVLESALAGRGQVLWIDLAAEAASSGIRPTDARLWHIGRFSFSEPFSRHLARRWAGLVLAALGKTARVVVLDLDNTCWGGVLGEDGIAGLKLDGDFPGNAYRAFQRAAKSLMSRGIALAVCSKNDEDLAVKAMDTLPGMQFHSADLAASRIGWLPKYMGLREISEEMNLGLESMLFVDDNPVEREAVRRNLPGVKVLDLPADPASYADALLSSPWLAAATITAEDRQRAQSYAARRAIESSRKDAASLEDFYAGLEMSVHFQPLDDGNIARAAQLCSKTNQFNSTTRRYNERELRAIVDQDGDVVVIGYQDRHGEFENIGLLILKPSENREGVVDNYLLSCRILGRGLEAAVLRWAQRRAALRGWSRLRGQVIETERNTPVRAVFRDAGFTSATEPGHWLIKADAAAPLPSYIKMCDRMTELGTKEPA